LQWSPADIADAVHEGLRRQAELDDLEQTVYGFDARDELGLHPLIQKALRHAGYGVWPEQRYPDDQLRPRRSEGRRCDLVLTRADLPLRDPLIRGTLFDHQPATDPQDAYWLEIKTVAQFQTDGPFARYSAELLAPVAEDVKKIWSDSVIRHGGLLLLLFTQSRQWAEHDLAAWHDRCLQRGLPVMPAAMRGLAITDRIGNAWCAAALFGIRGG
jgi:hypothetical protein